MAQWRSRGDIIVYIIGLMCMLIHVHVYFPAKHPSIIELVIRKSSGGHVELNRNAKRLSVTRDSVQVMWEYHSCYHCALSISCGHVCFSQRTHMSTCISPTKPKRGMSSASSVSGVQCLPLLLYCNQNNVISDHDLWESRWNSNSKHIFTHR